MTTNEASKPEIESIDGAPTSDDSPATTAEAPSDAEPSTEAAPDARSAEQETDAAEPPAVEAEAGPVGATEAGNAAPDDGEESTMQEATDVVEEAQPVVETDAAESGEPVTAPPERAAESEPAEAAEQKKGAAPDKKEAPAESKKVVALRTAREEHDTVEGKVIGWNNGGFHVVVGDVTAFCPRSEIEIGAPHAPETYLDKEMTFHVLNVQKKGKRVVLSRASVLRGERAAVREDAKKRLAPGSVVTGTVASLTEFGAFVDVGGGIHGLVHVSEISRDRVESPADVLEVGQEVEVQVLKLEKGGKRISLSMRALQPDPWREVREKFPEGAVVTGVVEKATSVGAFIQLEPGLTGLLPTSAMSIPREASPARVYPAGKEVKVTIMGVDSRRQRISLALEGSTSGGTRGDFQNYVKQQRGSGSTGGFNALADALKKIQSNAE